MLEIKRERGQRPNIKKDIWKRINKKGDNECWEWEGPITGRGYGSISINYREYAVHRLVYELTYDSIPKGLHVLHHCDNPKCCNPKHLFLGTNQDNVNDRNTKERQCRGEKNGMSKLSVSEVLEIRRLYNGTSNTYRTLSILYNVEPCTIRAIIKRINWKHI